MCSHFLSSQLKVCNNLNVRSFNNLDTQPVIMGQQHPGDF